MWRAKGRSGIFPSRSGLDLSRERGAPPPVRNARSSPAATHLCGPSGEEIKVPSALDSHRLVTDAPQESVGFEVFFRMFFFYVRARGEGAKRTQGWRCERQSWLCVCVFTAALGGPLCTAGARWTCERIYSISSSLADHTNGHNIAVTLESFESLIE